MFSQRVSRALFAFILFFHSCLSQERSQVTRCIVEMNAFHVQKKHGKVLQSCTNEAKQTYGCVLSTCNVKNKIKFKNCTSVSQPNSLHGQTITPLAFTALPGCDLIDVPVGIDSRGKKVRNLRCEAKSNPSPQSRPSCGECYVTSVPVGFSYSCN
ncbi:hypothetical protein O181_068165 [Austropuccinia psidii MF-1]|uniref:Secreted protein n=1 Tax=Austropuccinia psidii MF-1 TaxID=1389203 RepID=A0A9Q3ES28_9BASI|nr:hypothetical protein [Austropuccinia psidii MF-1]